MLAETGFGYNCDQHGGVMQKNSTLFEANKGHGRVTISDVARALDLTKSTVSRALNGYADISPSTQLRVKRMAEQMNYRPLSHAQAIKTGRTRALGLVLQLADHDAQRPFLAEFLAGLSKGATQEGYTLTVASADCDAHVIETFKSLLRDRKADGFILPRTMVEDPRVNMLREANVPFVLFGRQEDETECCWFDVRGEDAMRDAVLHLAQLGHQRIAFINSGHKYYYARMREQGYLDGLLKAGLDVDPEIMLEGAVTLQDGVQASGVLLSRETAPTAIVCAVDQVALGIYRTAADRGLVIGRDLSVIGYDGVKDGAHVQPPLTTYQVDNTAAGAELAALLIRRVRGEPADTLRKTVAATFVDRGSTGPAPHSEITN